MTTQTEQQLETNLIKQLTHLGFTKAKIADNKELETNLKKN